MLFRRDRLETRFASPRWRETREPVPREAVLDQLRNVDKARCARVIFSGGAPLEHPHFDAILEEASQLGFHRLSLETEPSPLSDKALLDSLVDRGFAEFIVHLGGLSEAVHERALSAPGTYAQALRGLQNLAVSQARCEAVLPLLKWNAHEVAPLAARVIEIGGWPFKGVLLAPSGPGAVRPAFHGELLSPVEVARVARDVFLVCQDNSVEYGFTNRRGLVPCASSALFEGFQPVFHEWTESLKGGRREAPLQRIPACAECSVAPTCPGVDPAVIDCFGTSGLAPVPAEVSSTWSTKPAGRRLDPATVLPDYLRDGFVMLRGAIPRPLLKGLQAAFDRLLDPVIAANPTQLLHYEKNLIERDPLFLELIDLPSIYPLPRAIIGADITLVHGGLAYSKRANSPSYLSWHNDFNWMVDVPYPRPDWWVRILYFIDDIDEHTSPTAVIPGSHRATHVCPSDLTAPDGQPRELPGMVRLTGRAGDCAVFNPEIWHANTPNTSDRPRKFVMLTYKHAWMRQWTNGHEISPAFAEAQRNPLRWQLCGGGIWHRQHGLWQA